MGWVQGHDKSRIEQFVRAYGERAFQFAYRLSGNVEEAKDLVAEAFRRLFDRWERYDPSQPLDAWFFTILRHLFIDGRKRYERRHALSLDRPRPGAEGEEGGSFADTLADREEAVLERLEREESVQEVRRALDRLSWEHKAVLTLCDMEQMSYEEIARVLEVPLGTVRSRVNRARRALRRALAEGP